MAEAKLQWWRGEVAALFDRQPTHPVTRALLPFIDGPFGITRERLLAILEGMEMDLRQNRYLDFAALKRYAHLVAGVVGEISAAVFGYSDPRTLEFAGRLGLALQLINVIRDVGDDARRGRIYLPLDELQRFGVRAADLLNGRYVDGFVPLMRFQARARARHLPRGARAASARRSARAAPGLIMGAIYATLLDEIEREDFQVLHQRVALTPLRKLLDRVAHVDPAVTRPRTVAVVGGRMGRLRSRGRAGRGRRCRSRCSKPPPNWAGAAGAWRSSWTASRTRSTTAST